jgi:tetratricopeptide (TPR) repeat protein
MLSFMGPTGEPILKPRHFSLLAALAMWMVLAAILCSKRVNQKTSTSKSVEQARACYSRSRSYAARGQRDAAIAQFTKAIRLDQTFPYSYWERGGLYDRLGRHAEALADFTQVIALGALERGYISRGCAYARHGEHDQAIADFNDLIRVNPKSNIAYNVRSNSYRIIAKYDQAIADFTEAITLVTQHSPAAVWEALAASYHGRGLVYADKGEHNLAIADFTQAIRLMPYLQVAYRDRGLSYASKGQHDKAVADFTQATQLDPNDAKA